MAVPYIMVAGNHDFGFTNADNRDTMINNYFKATDNSLTDPAQGGILKGTKVAGDLTNAYYAFTAPDGRKMLILALEWEPRPATVTWANQIAALPEFADHTASLVTHNYLLGNNVRSTSTNVAADASGQELWDNLVKQHENFEMTFNGHFGGDGAGYLVSTSNAGQPRSPDVSEHAVRNARRQRLDSDSRIPARWQRRFACAPIRRS